MNKWESLNKDIDDSVREDLNHFFKEIDYSTAKNLLKTKENVYGIDYEGQESLCRSVEEIKHYDMYAIETTKPKERIFDGFEMKIGEEVN